MEQENSNNLNDTPLKEKKSMDNSDNSVTLPDEFAEILESVPVEKREFIERTMIAGFSMMGNNSPSSAIAQKITSEHITKFLETSSDDMQNHYREKKQNKIFIAAVLLIVFVFFIILVGMLKDNANLLEKIITSTISLIVGLIGGYGFGKTKSED